MALSAALLLAVLVAGLLAMWWRLERDARALANSLKRVGLRALDTQRRVDAQVRLARAQQFTESAVDLTSATVRAVHRRIAAIPFGLLARTPEAKAQVLRAQALHDETAEAVYGASTPSTGWSVEASGAASASMTRCHLRPRTHRTKAARNRLSAESRGGSDRGILTKGLNQDDRLTRY